MAFLLYQGELIELSSKVEKVNSVLLENEIKIVDEGDGFYRSIDSSIAPDDRVVILDRGNFLIHIFSKDGKKSHSFGKEGNGPGELSSAGRIKALHKRILLINRLRLLIFSYEGKLIKEIKGSYSQAALTFTENDFTFTFPAAEHPPILSVTYNLSAEKINEVKNESNEEAVNINTLEITDRIDHFFHAPKEFIVYQNHFIRRFQGEYKLIHVNRNGTITKTIKRAFNRIKGAPVIPLTIRTQGDLSDAEKKRVAKMRESVAAQQLQLTGGFMNDIVEIVGVINNYILLHVASEDKKTWKIDVISPDDKYYTQFDYSHEDLAWMTVSNNKLIVECENDDIGPYIRIFDLRIL
jgi:hypothetical protein